MLYRFVDQSLGGFRCCLATGAVIASASLFFLETAKAQSNVNSGMTTATSNPTEYELEMMQIRAAAQEARGEAAAAQMARTADQAMEERHMEATLQKARETKALKRDAQNRIKWQKAQNAYNKITADEMSTWRGSNGGVRVERNVPNEFLLQLREEERLIAAQNAEQQEAESGFAPIAATKKMLSWRPFSGRREEPSNYTQTYATAYNGSGGQAEEQRGGFMSNIHLPRLPIGGGRSEEQSTYTAPQAQPAPAQSVNYANQTQNVPVTATVTKPGSVPRISGAELVDGQTSVNRQTQGQQNSQSSNQSEPNYTQAYVQTSEPQFADSGEDEKKGGLFSFLKTDGSNGGIGSGGGGFSFGKKKGPHGSGGIDASLFPTDALYTQPTGGELGTTDPDPQEVEAPQQNYAADSMPVDMPSTSGSNEKRKSGGGGFTIPKPNISIPKIGGDGGGITASKPAAPSNSIVNSNGNSYYVVSSTAQFMQYGENQMDSEIRAINPGMVVRMTKPGADWVGVQLSDGSQGVIQMKNLRAASSGEIPSGF